MTAKCVDALFARARGQHSIKQIAQLLCVQTGTVERWVKKGVVPPFYRNDLLRVLGMDDAFAIGMKESDQFYTLPAVAKACVDEFCATLRRHGVNLSDCRFIEPSAGCGHFYNLLPPQRRLGVDIAPAPSPMDNQFPAEIIKADFLQWTPPPSERRQVVVGNPPFGRNGKTALDFVIKSFQFAEFVGFILPPIFNSTGKGSCYNRLTRRGHVVLAQRELNDSSFVCPDGRNVGVKTIFQVWARQAPRGYQPQIRRSCDEYVDIYNIYISKKPGRPSSHPELAGQCDIYIPRSFWGSREIKATDDFADIPYQDGYGIVIKRRRRDIARFMRSFDWRRAAHVSTNGSMTLRRDIIKDQLVHAGFADRGLL